MIGAAMEDRQDWRPSPFCNKATKGTSKKGSAAATAKCAHADGDEDMDEPLTSRKSTARKIKT